MSEKSFPHVVGDDDDVRAIAPHDVAVQRELLARAGSADPEIQHLDPDGRVGALQPLLEQADGSGLLVTGDRRDERVTEDRDPQGARGTLVRHVLPPEPLAVESQPDLAIRFLDEDGRVESRPVGLADHRMAHPHRRRDPAGEPQPDLGHPGHQEQAGQDQAEVGRPPPDSAQRAGFPAVPA